METIDLEFEPTIVPEWHVNDDVSFTLGKKPEPMSVEEQQEFLKGIRLSLPKELDTTELTQYRKKETPISSEVQPGEKDLHYYLIQMPLSMIVPDKSKRITQFTLELTFDPDSYQNKPIVTYDLYPKTTSQEHEIINGEVDVDLSKALNVIPIVGTVIDNCVDIKLKKSLNWKTTRLNIQAGGILDNRITWHVQDKAINEGFNGYAIVKAPKDAKFDIKAKVIFELYKGIFEKCEYVSRENSYHIP